MSKEQIPKTMRGVIYTSPTDKLVIKNDIPVPVPASGQVLVKVMASPINPSDIGYLKGYSRNKLPVPGSPGFEGSGLVVQNGGGLIGWYLNGKKVSFSTGQNASSGAWTEYVAVDAKMCIAQNNSTSFEAAACAIVNPLTVLGMLDLVKELKYKAVVQNAAASQLGKMMIKLFKENKIPLINIVRRQEQVDLLKNELEAQYVLNSEDPNFETNFKQLCDQLNATCFFDAVSGSQTAKIMNKMPSGTTAYIYGALSYEGVEVDASDLIFRKKQVKGFMLTDYIQKKGFLWTLNAINQVSKLINTTFKSTIAKEFTFSDDPNEALEFYLKNMTAGKIIFKPNIANELQQQQNQTQNQNEISYQK